jgi:tRNA (guanine-N7-)-methyltransferase
MADARLFFRGCVRDGSVQAVHVYFPDPWWKKRHHKRRVFTPEFAAACERALRPGGRLHIVTDVEEYFGVMTELAAARPGLHPLPADEGQGQAEERDYLTNFDRKSREQGRAVYRAMFERAGDVVPS